MKTELTQVDKIKKLLKLEVSKSQINLATETLNEGEATIEAEVFEAGEPVMIVNEEDRIPLPANEDGYLLDNGMLLIVVEEGIIAEIKDPEQEEEVPAEGEEEVAASDDKSETPLPKAIIESVVKETKFSAEEMDAKELEITELKAQIAELTKEEVVEEVELSVKPITHNPENKQEVKGFKFGNKGNQTAAQIIMSKMANRK